MLRHFNQCSPHIDATLRAYCNRSTDESIRKQLVKYDLERKRITNEPAPDAYNLERSLIHSVDAMHSRMNNTPVSEHVAYGFATLLSISTLALFWYKSI